MSDEALDFSQLAQEASAYFFAMMQQRHEMGERKYGTIKFMDVNTLNEAMEEVADLGNYAMYTFMKLYILNLQLKKIMPEEGVDLLGPQAFIKSGE